MTTRPEPVWAFDDYAHFVPEDGFITDYLTNSSRPIEVANGRLYNGEIIVEVTDRQVALATEQSADTTCLVVVVDKQWPPSVTDRASTVLLGGQPLELVFGQGIFEETAPTASVGASTTDRSVRPSRIGSTGAAEAAIDECTTLLAHPFEALVAVDVPDSCYTRWMPNTNPSRLVALTAAQLVDGAASAHSTAGNNLNRRMAGAETACQCCTPPSLLTVEAVLTAFSMRCCRTFWMSRAKWAI